MAVTNEGKNGEHYDEESVGHKPEAKQKKEKPPMSGSAGITIGPLAERFFAYAFVCLVQAARAPLCPKDKKGGPGEECYSERRHYGFIKNLNWKNEIKINA